VNFWLLMVLSLTAGLLQTTVAGHIAIAGVHPDFVFILALNCGLIGGPMAGLWGGLAGGFLVDIINGRLLGLNALTIALVAYLAGLAERKVYKDSIPMLAAFTFMGTVAQQSFFMGLLWVFNVPVAVGPAFLHIILPLAVYNAVLSPFVYGQLQKRNTSAQLRARQDSSFGQ
jgi:rod shape-determining protein MreD